MGDRMIVKLVLVGTLVVTAYRPVSWQTKPECTNRSNCRTSIGDNTSETGMAISQDLLANGTVHYGDCLYIPDIGYRVVNDTMAKRNNKAADILVFTKNEERKIGVRHTKVYLIRVEEK
jgi:3D (Asp-Asp-Asp) domain-containing protein